MIEISSKEIKRLAAKAKKEMARNDEFKPQLISIFRLCEEYGITEYFGQIRNRIFYEGEQNKEIFQHVLIAAHNIKDVNLSAKGLLLLRDLLAGYFPLKDIIELHEYFDDKNKRGELEFNYVKVLRDQPKQCLKDMFEEIMNQEIPLEQQKDKDFKLSAIRDEIARKSTFRYRLRKYKKYLYMPLTY